MINERLLERLFYIEKCGSFSKAAEELYVSRSALVQQVKQLECELGFDIFRRDHRGITLTEAGTLYFQEANSLVRAYNDAISRCMKASGKPGEVITIGSIPNLYPVIVPDICKVFLKKHPDVKIEFKDFPLAVFWQKFQMGEFDIAAEYLGDYIFENEMFELTPLSTTGLRCMVTPSSSFADLDVITFDDLRGHKLMMYRKGLTYNSNKMHEIIRKQYPDIEVIDIDAYTTSIRTRCEIEDAALLTYEMYGSSFGGFISKPTNWNIPINLGLRHSKNCRSIVREFIEVAKSDEVARMIEQKKRDVWTKE